MSNQTYAERVADRRAYEQSTDRLIAALFACTLTLIMGALVITLLITNGLT